MENPLHKIFLELEKLNAVQSLYGNSLTGEIEGISYIVSEYFNKPDRISVNRSTIPKNSIEKTLHQRKDCYSIEESINFILNGLNEKEILKDKILDEIEVQIRKMRNNLHELKFEDSIKHANNFEGFIITLKNLKLEHL